jgi:sugar phosphate isomerase/epimerase
MALSLSTAWNAFRYSDGYKMLFEIKELGLETAELSFNITTPMIAGVKQAIGEGLVKITSIHNTCPIPENLSRQEALPDYYPMSSLDDEKRRLAVKYAKISIDTACSLGAQALVLHCGRLEIPDRTRQLIELYDQKLGSSEEFTFILSSLKQERDKLAGRFFDNTLKSLEEINEYAKTKNLALGVENRFYYREIPSFEETKVILEKFKGSNIFYWHDTGHAQIMSNLGLAPAQEEVLSRYGSSLIGLHLHDVFGCKDHLAPGKGGLDFKFLTPYLKKDTLKVIEAHHPATAEDIKNSRNLLTAIFNE